MLAAISADTLAPYERGQKSRAEMAAELGISERWLRKLLARERAQPVEESRGADELPYVELVYGRRTGLHYRLDEDTDSVLPHGPFRIGDHNGRRLQVARSGDGAKVEQPSESKHKFKPKARKKKRVG